MLSSILQKPLGAITVLGTAIGGPYALFETELGTTARSAIQGMLTSTPADQSTAVSGGAVPEGMTPLTHGMLTHGMLTHGMLGPNNAPIAGTAISPSVPQPLASQPLASQPNGLQPNGLQILATGPRTTGSATTPWTPPPIYDLREVIRFDMNPLMLPQRFGQVTSLAGYPQFEAYRVPLTTGTGPTDLVGTLTYCFDANKIVQRIQFMGTTGDPSVIAGMMVNFYGLRPESHLGGQLFTTRWNNRVTSLLHVRPANVMTANSPSGNYHVFLELNQPSTYYGLSEEAYRETGISPPASSGSFFGF